MLSAFETSLCDMQGKLFEIGAERGYESASFIQAFMSSKIARELDSAFNYMQWAGKEYIMERMEDELSDSLHFGEVWDAEILFWIGYVYRYWHFLTGESSKSILRQAPPKRLQTLYYGYHTFSVELAIEKLKENK